MILHAAKISLLFEPSPSKAHLLVALPYRLCKAHLEIRLGTCSVNPMDKLTGKRGGNPGRLSCRTYVT
jgi:hypothetical protein